MALRRAKTSSAAVSNTLLSGTAIMSRSDNQFHLGGTGVTAVILDTALEAAGWNVDKKRVYDGSWTEWAQRVQPGDNLIRSV